MRLNFFRKFHYDDGIRWALNLKTFVFYFSLCLGRKRSRRDSAVDDYQPFGGINGNESDTMCSENDC